MYTHATVIGHYTNNSDDCVQQLDGLYTDEETVNIYNEIQQEVVYDSIEDIDEEQLKIFGIYKIDDNLNTYVYDDFHYELTERHFSFWTFDSTAEIVYKEYDIRSLTVVEKKELMYKDLARIRYERETQGIIVNGIKIASDRSTQSMLNNAIQIMREDPDKLIWWKGIENWTEIDLTTITVISQCMVDYVEKCFRNEKGLYDRIRLVVDNDWDDLETIDLNAGWPEYVYNV